MSDELERLRDVARAAAAFVEAEDKFLALARAFNDEGQPIGDQLHQATYALHPRGDDLRRALARLAELNPPT